MASRALSLIIAALVLGTLALVMTRADGGWGADWPALRFTVMQAFLSALLSVALAVPVARALARRRFRGRGLLIALLGAPFLLPVIVAVLGLLAIFGRNGLINHIGLPPLSIYGLHGVVLAHVFFNMPLAVRLILQGWQAIPAERFRLALSLGFGPRDIARHLERPMLREVLPGTAVVIFVICLASFAVALTLGGGPAATTVELAIYQALRFEFDLGRAASLSALQFVICAVAVLVASRFAVPAGFGAGLDRHIAFAPAGWRRFTDAATLVLATGFVALPLAMVAARGLPGLANLPASVWQAAVRSIMVALGSTLLTVGAALVLALARSRSVELAATLPLAASSLVLGTGLFLAIHPFAAPETLALPVTILVNATLALPFAFRILAPAARQVDADFGRLAASLDLSGPAKLRWLILPRLRRPLGFAAGVSAALSMGDLGVIALFAGQGNATLPLLVQQLMGAYRMEQAAGAALLLVMLSFALFWIFDYGGRRGAEP